MIDWDNLADELADSPRARIAQALEEADKMRAVLIVFESETEEHLASEYCYYTGLRQGVGGASLLGLAEWVKSQLIEGMR